MKVIQIKDYYGNYQSVPVSDDLYEEWRLLQNETQRIYRKEVYHRSHLTLDEADAVIGNRSDSTLDDSLLQAEEIAALYEAISKLTARQRRMIYLLLDGMTMHEMAASNKLHYNTVTQTIRIAKKKLRKYLGDGFLLR